ncbi:MAG: hypothetical protein ACRDBQ_10415 [Shewanella sp.]
MSLFDTAKNYLLGILLIACVLLGLSVWGQRTAIGTLTESLNTAESNLRNSIEQVKSLEEEKAKLSAFHKQDLDLVVKSWQQDRETRRQTNAITTKAEAIYHEQSEVKKWGDTAIPADYLELLKSRNRLSNP